jgi:phosphonate transport system substrate-binding protein
MVLRIRWIAAAAVITMIGVSQLSSLQALDTRFKDTDGDLVADVPADPKDQIDPPVLIFAYTPVEDPAVYAKVWDGFLKHMEKLTGKRVQFFPVQSNAAQIEAMRAGRLHVAGFNTGATPLAVNCAGFVPFTMMSTKDGTFGYQMEIVTYPGSGIEKVADLKGKKVAFTAETSNAGFKAPSAILRDKFGLEVRKDIDPVFSGKYDNSILGVANKDYPAAAVANSVLKRMIARGVVKKEQITSIFISESFPATAYGTVYNLKPELASKIQGAFFSFPWEGSALFNEFKNNEPPVDHFLKINYKQHWQIIRDIDTALNVTYACK